MFTIFSHMALYYWRFDSWLPQSQGNYFLYLYIPIQNHLVLISVIWYSSLSEFAFNRLCFVYFYPLQLVKIVWNPNLIPPPQSPTPTHKSRILWTCMSSLEKLSSMINLFSRSIRHCWSFPTYPNAFSAGVYPKLFKTTGTTPNLYFHSPSFPTHLLFLLQFLLSEQDSSPRVSGLGDGPPSLHSPHHQSVTMLFPFST